MCRAGMVILTVLVGVVWLEAAHAQPLADHDVHPQPDIPRPVAGAAITDPVFGTRMVRISDARAMGRAGIVPDYPKRQAWNADESLLLLRTGDGAALLYDGATYGFIRELDGVEGEDVFWHPTDPAIVLYNPDTTLYAYNVATGARSVVQRFPEYAFANTRGEGNLSADGRYYAFAGQLYDEATGEVTFKDLVVYDIVTGQVTARMALPALDDFDWVSISPLGDYVVVDYADELPGRFHGVEVYDRSLTFLWQHGLGSGHSDLAVDANGDEVLVMGVYDADTNRSFVKKYRLADGQETTLLGYSWMFDSHISCRNEARRGWCVVSTYDSTARLSDSATSWLPFEDEIFALELDGSGSVERLAHHHSRRFSPSTPDADTSTYFAEPHATVSRRGDRVLFGSNWRQDLADPAGVDAYVVERPAGE